MTLAWRLPVLGFALVALAACESTGAIDSDAGVAPADMGNNPMDAALVDQGPADLGAQVDAASDAAEPLPGRALYEEHCALCHGASGEGYLADNAPAIGGASYLSVATNSFLYDAIYDGRPGTPMSAWGDAHGGPLSSADTAIVVEYLRSWATLPPVDVAADVVVGDATEGAPLFATHCASCHGENGDGVSAVSLNHPNFLATASDGFVQFAVVNGRPGTAMESWAGILTPVEIGHIVKFVRTLVREDPMTMELPIEPAPSLDALVINPEGASADFLLRDDRFVPALDVKHALDTHARIVLLDARAASDWAIAHIVGAAPFPFYDVDELAMYLPNDGTWIVAYCACPHAASGAVVDQLRARGFMNTAVLDEGVNYWRDMEYPMARGMLPE